MTPQDLTYIIFLFALGAAVGSFINVVVWRLPRIEIPDNASFVRQILTLIQGLSSPPSHCPKCNHRLAWRDNIPIFGWLLLRGKCRYCRASISIRYPIVELANAILFALFYILFFMHQIGPCPKAFTPGFELNIQEHWPILALYLFAASSLLASSLIDAELFIIPIEIPWLLAIVAMIAHALIDRPTFPGALNTSAAWSALSAGGGVGLIISAGLLALGIMPISFAKGEPILEADRAAMLEEIAKSKETSTPMEVPPEYTSWQIRLEMSKEMLFLLPPLLFAAISLLLYKQIPSVRHFWTTLSTRHWLTGLLGSCLGAMIGAFVVWFTRIFGTLGFGRVAMGLGDVHLMFGVGAAIGAGASTIAFFIAPFFGLAIAVYCLITRARRELPYGPYLSLGSVFVMFFYCPLAEYLTPGLFAIRQMLSGL